MFSKLTQNRDGPKGKQAAEQTIKNITTQYSIGKPEWQQDYVSHTHTCFNVSDS